MKYFVRLTRNVCVRWLRTTETEIRKLLKAFYEHETLVLQAPSALPGEIRPVGWHSWKCRGRDSLVYLFSELAEYTV